MAYELLALAAEYQLVAAASRRGCSFSLAVIQHLTENTCFDLRASAIFRAPGWQLQQPLPLSAVATMVVVPIVAVVDDPVETNFASGHLLLSF